MKRIWPATVLLLILIGSIIGIGAKIDIRDLNISLGNFSVSRN